jgi:hypothetical protein
MTPSSTTQLMANVSAWSPPQSTALNIKKLVLASVILVIGSDHLGYWLRLFWSQAPINLVTGSDHLGRWLLHGKYLGDSLLHGTSDTGR